MIITPVALCDPDKVLNLTLSTNLIPAITDATIISDKIELISELIMILANTLKEIMSY